MQPVLQAFFGRLFTHKLLYCLQFTFTTALKPTGIVENVTVVVREDKLIANVMFASL